jgi:hypothetical protein
MNRHNSREIRRKSLWSLSISGSLPIFHKKMSKAEERREKRQFNDSVIFSADEKKYKDLFFMTSLNLHLPAQSFRA